ncbi:hypothetical protein BH10ACT7_BH10ACT7_15820 [soil metagenome]
MADDLWISGGGTTSVATDELYASAQKLAQLVLEVNQMQSRLGAVDRTISMDWLAAARAPSAAAQAELEIDQAKIVLMEIEVQARLVQWSLNAAADGYGFVERFLGGVGEALMGAAGHVAGQFAPAIALSPAGLAGVGALAATAPLVFSKENNSLVTNPVAAGFVRNATMSVDEGMLGAAGVPLPVATALGGLGVTGLAFAAGGGMRAGSLAGALTETPVHLAGQRRVDVDAAPQGYSERLARVPDCDRAGGSQVTIERYEMPDGSERFEVYVTGTVTFDPVATTEPWDMTSNLANAAGEDGGSYRSVVQAMELAGVTAETPVQFTGYSQGGGTVARIAASGDFSTAGVLTFGGPTGQIPVPADVTAVIVEHKDDIVPALGGAQANRDAVIIERDVFADRDIPKQYAVPAHHREYYEETASLMDGADSEQVTGAIAKLDSFTAGATKVTSTTYRFERG